MTILTTWTGMQVNYLNPSTDQIEIEDIATALSRESRFAGHSMHFYSVAQHSVVCSSIVPDELALEALLHDAAEAYLKDIPSPLKCLLPDYQKIEERFDRVIRKRFCLPEAHSDEVKNADQVILVTEMRDLLGWKVHHRISPIAPLGISIKAVSPDVARDMFIRRFNYLVGDRY